MADEVADLNFTLHKGSKFLKILTWKSAGVAIDLTAFTGKMDVKRSINDVETVLQFTTADTTMVLGGVAGTITLLISSEETSKLLPMTGVYDLQVNDTADDTKVARGAFFIVDEVTK